MLLPDSTSSSTISEWTFMTSQPSLTALTWLAASDVAPMNNASAKAPMKRPKFDMQLLLLASQSEAQRVELQGGRQATAKPDSSLRSWSVGNQTVRVHRGSSAGTIE